MSASDPVDAFEDTCQIQPPRPTTEDRMIGRHVIGQYRIEKKLGAGGMGAVYLAQQTSVSRPAVIKVLRSQLGGASENDSVRFAVEAKAASSLNHPNIVTIYNYGKMEDDTLFIAMEYLAGETLAERLERCGPFSVERAVHIAAQVARALGEAHAHGVVHRDLKPANVMLVERAGESDFVKVLDFGIAKMDDESVTSTGYVVGTPRYMSPEQLLGMRLDCRSDIYSAGVVLYEMLTGVTPFQSETPLGWLHQHVEVAPKPPSALAKGGKIPEPVDRVVLRALAKVPADRPPSMEMLSLDLVAALNAPTEPPPRPRWRRAAVRGAKLAAAVLVALVSGTRRFLRAIGSHARARARAIRSGTWRFLRAIGSGAWRSTRAIGSGARKFVRTTGSRTWRCLRTTASTASRPLRAIEAAAQRSPAAGASAVRQSVRQSVPAPARRSLGSMPLSRRLLIALLVVLASAALLVALFPQVRSDFGLTGNDKPSADKTKRPQAPAPPPARDRSRDKAR